MYPSLISNEEVNALELCSYEGKIHIISNAEQIPAVLKKISKETAVGFDTETKPAFKKGQVNEVSLIQIATNKEVFLIRVNLTGLTKELIAFFEDEKHLKIGVALRDDLIDLRRLNEFDPKGFLELNKLVKEIGIESNGLRKLTAIILGFRISKSAQISNWENETLTDKQIKYAATDAWVCLKMYNELCKKGYINYK